MKWLIFPRGGFGDDRYMQACFTAFEECPTPVVAAVDGAAYGAAVDLLTCCDLRYCTTSARFCVKEVCAFSERIPTPAVVPLVQGAYARDQRTDQGGVHKYRAGGRGPHAQPDRPIRGAPPAAAGQLHLLPSAV
jgi:hypothetical protein